MKKGVYLLKLELENVRCFSNKAMLDLSNENRTWKRWTVILGNNGTGKTTLLQTLSDLEFEAELMMDNTSITRLSYILVFRNRVKVDRKKNGFIRATTTLCKSDLGYDIGGWFENGERVITPVNNVNQDYTLLKIYGYGANRAMSEESLNDDLSTNSEALYNNDAKLINAEKWLLNLDYAASRESEIKTYAIKKREQVKELLLEVLPDIDDIRFTEPTKEKLIPIVEFKTPFSWVTIHQLSLGYRTMVAWMVDLAARMFERYPDSDNPLAEPAIVLVDEIDLHMHPKWQRKIFDYLSEKFPKTQFIVTAHSPLIVQSAPKDANIVLLRREGDHVVIDNDIQSVHNWRIDQILNSDLFGNISQRSPETEEWMNERKTLIQKEKRTDKEEQRLKELNQKAHELPTADNPRDIEAMEIIREAAEYLKSQKFGTPV